MIQYISKPFKYFFKLESASGLVLLFAAVIALFISNSSLGENYFKILESYLTLGTKDFGLKLSVLHWINDVLMAIFFFLVSLEIKREFVKGELSNPKQAMLPIIGAVGGMVVAGPEGFQRAAYRRFNIKDQGKFATQTGDDFAMMRQEMHRRFSRALREDPDQISGNWPDLLLIDGGLGQLSSVHEVLDDLAIFNLQVVAISKGPDRHAGRERFHIRGRPSFSLPSDSAAMHFLQRLRDEAHRYAIGTHRTKRAKAEFTNPLDAMPGIGPKRKKALLAHFGSARAVASAGLSDLQAVDGISKKFAQQIYDWFYSGGQ